MRFRSTPRKGWISVVLGGARSSEPEGEGEPEHTETRAQRPPRRPAPSGRVPKLPTARILIIDDEAPVANALRRLLRHHQVSVALNGQEALALLEREPFDVVVSDVMMPAPSGADVYRRLRAHGSPMVSRFIFITGGGHDREARRFLDTIPNACLDKPADPAELEQAIGDVLRGTLPGVGHGAP